MASRRSRASGSRGQALPLLVSLLLAASGFALVSMRDDGPTDRRAGLASGSLVLYVPAGAHAPGANGANWRTDLEVHNAGAVAVSYTVELLKRDSANAAPESRTFSLGPQQSVRHADALWGIFSYTGSGALRVTASSDQVVVTSRTYNQIGTNPWGLPEGSSFGQFVPGIPEGEAIGYGEEGRLIQLTQREATSLEEFRTNVALLNVTGGVVDVRVDLYRADGTYLGTRQGSETQLRAYETRQLNEVFKPWGAIADGYAVVRPVTAGGRILALATVMDNHNSGDPICIPASKMTAGSGPSPSPTPTPTSTPPVGPTPTPTPTRTPTPPTDTTPTPPTGGAVIPPIAFVSSAMTSLSQLDTSKINLLGLHNAAISGGIAGVAAEIVKVYPELQSIGSVSGDSVLINFGDRYVSSGGSVYTGSARIDTVSHSTTGSHTMWTGRVTPTNLTKNGQTMPFGEMTVSTDFTSSGSTVVGDVSLTAQDASNPSQTLATGTAHFDSSRCEKFPVSGSIQIHYGGQTRTVTFTDACDGSFGYDAPMGGYYVFAGTYAPEDETGNDCYKPPGLFAIPLYVGVFVAQDGTFVADPGFTSITDPKYQYTFGGTGWYTGAAAYVRFRLGWTEFDESTPYARINISATFSGVRTAIPPDVETTVRDYFTGLTNVVFTTSAPYKPCTTTLVTGGMLLGPCPKPHCSSE